MQIIPAAVGSVIISVEYQFEDAGRWARLYDSPVLGWAVDELGAAGPSPVIIGSLPVAPTDAPPIISPQWASFNDPAVFVPDLWRGLFPDFLTWLATNNGAHRPLQARFAVHSTLLNLFNEWAAAHPELVFEGDPPEAPEPPADAPATEGVRR